ncbi:MAG: hypothetical protein B0D92_05975 [Spirochaeta sp. LUC14_002_19_P3]|nr:MAG: hypothetical protein B0D92_05975 [Spirochaeta sp. LUC14_002_19_P3]
MAKNIFHQVEIEDITRQKVQLEAPVFTIKHDYSTDISREKARLNELKAEAEMFRTSWVEEKERMIEDAREEAERIKNSAEDTVLETVRNKTEAAEKTLKEAEDEAAFIKTRAEEDARQIIEEAEANRDRVYEEAREEARTEGRKIGWDDGNAEVERLTERIHGIINAMIEKRREIIEDVETELIELVLLIARKVVKVISENQKNIVIHNIVQALKKLKSRGDVAIRVNLSDLNMASEHIKDFIQLVEHVKSISVLEDSSVDKGGAVIETDFGEIDARIHNQLREIEDKILDIVPIKTNGEGEDVSG